MGGGREREKKGEREKKEEREKEQMDPVSSFF